MCRSGSPWTYCRCWANSVENPRSGDLCIPTRLPSTTWRASSSSCEVFWSVAGSRYGDCLLFASLAMVHALVGRDGVQELLHDVVGGESLALSGEVGDQAVAEDGQRDGLHVLDRDVEPPVQHRAGLAGEDQVQAGARAGADGDPILDERGGEGVI